MEEVTFEQKPRGRKARPRWGKENCRLREEQLQSLRSLAWLREKKKSELLKCSEGRGDWHETRSDTRWAQLLKGTRRNMNAIPLECIKRRDCKLINLVLSSLWLLCGKWTTSGARAKAQRPVGDHEASQKV